MGIHFEAGDARHRVRIGGWVGKTVRAAGPRHRRRHAINSGEVRGQDCGRETHIREILLLLAAQIVPVPEVGSQHRGNVHWCLLRRIHFVLPYPLLKKGGALFRVKQISGLGFRV